MRIIALGFFDSIHIGHKKIIKECIKISDKKGLIPSVFMFDGDLKAYFDPAYSGTVFTLTERKKLIKELGVKDFIVKKVEKSFLDLEAEEFLDLLVKEYNASGFVCGFDYSFGKGGLGTTEFLKEYCIKKGLILKIIGEVKRGNKKVSTSRIKDLLKNGKIKKANELLGSFYFITSVVKEGRKVGKTLGFPTVNLKVNGKKIALKQGVYKGKIFLDGIEYKTIINYGKAPTFNVKKRLVEAYILGFDGNLYGKKITLYFEDFLREIKKFKSKEGLIKQLNKDIESIK
ncbi:MAG: riboflavin biosynthesis protein RibF [Clostridiales bacterium]|nr:riboflavin biosynthesis protein RibF [Clostridiales bacterium]